MLPIFILIDFPMHVDRISAPIIYDAILCLKVVFIFANSADPDEMPPYAVFHLGQNCLPKYLFTGIQIEKG